MSLPSAVPAPTLAARPVAPARPTLPDALFNAFVMLIYDLSGMRFDVSKAYFLASKIENRVQALGLKTAEAYLAYINSPSGRSEYGYLIDEVTINETFFFRHEPQLNALRDTLLQPLIFARRAQRASRFRIWSCAASTGDELYTIALMLKELNLIGPNRTTDMQFELIGSDICHNALQKARAGVYQKYNIRNVPPAMLAQNFTATPGGETWTINPDIKALCRFQEGNLFDANRCNALGKFDLIICRNVLIYFDEPSKEQAVRNIANCLADDGFVMMGHSEDIYGQRHLLRPDKTHANAIAFQKASLNAPKL